MKNKIIILFFTVIFSFSLCGCNVIRETTENAGLSIIATSFPGYDFARAVIGEGNTDIELKMLLSPGEETHSFDPTPLDMAEIENCDLFIYVGGESDAWIEEILATPEGERISGFPLIQCVELREEEEKEGMMEEKDGEHSHKHQEEDEHSSAESDLPEEESEYDEHIWTSPVNAMAMVNQLTSEICKLDPENKERYQNNADDYLSELFQLDTAFRNVCAGSKRNTVVFGDRFPFLYFVKEYGLDYYAAFPGCSSETEPNAATVAFLIDKVRAEDIPIIFKESLSNGNIAEAIAEECKAKVRNFYSCHNISADDFNNGETYVSLMKKNLAALEEALN